MNPQQDAAKMMELACTQAELGRGRTSPNPLVGAVVVDEGGPGPFVLATGYHARPGRDHAEIDALRKLAMEARGKTVYVTLEPCNHVGRTGKCTEVLIKAGVRKVVVGMRDPNPLVAGGGIERLRSAGVQVEVGVLEAACRRQNRGYLNWLRTGRPHLILKAAVSLDGCLAPQGPGPYWLTGEQAVMRAHQLRDGCDGILVGAGTILADDPQLSVRLPVEQRRQPDDRQPLRIILDGALRTPSTARILSSRPGPLILTSTVAAQQHPDRVRALSDAGAEVVPLPDPHPGPLPVAGEGDGQQTGLDLHAVLRFLGQRDLLMVMCEGGSTLHGALLRAGLYDEAAIFMAPVFLGEGAVPLARGFAVPAFPAAPWLSEVTVEPLGRDVLLHGDLKTPEEGTCSPD